MNKEELRAFRKLLTTTIIAIRANSKAISGQQLFDIMDAIHNIPEAFEDNTWVVPSEFVKLYLMPYDSRWFNNPDDRIGISLVKEFYNNIKVA